MSMEINDNLFDDVNPYDNRTVVGEWVEMHFPIGTLPIYSGDGLDPDPQYYLNIQFDQGNPCLLIKMADNDNGLRASNDETVFSFCLPVELLNRLSRIARN